MSCCEHVIAFATVATVVFGLATATLVAYPSNRLSFLDAIASPSTYPVSGSVIVSFRLEICSYRISELCKLVLYESLSSNR